MKLLSRLIKPVYAHCDLMCGVYDPAQARIEAQSVLNTVKKYHESNDDTFKARCVIIKEQRAEQVKNHLWVLWTDYFKEEHAEKFPELHELFWKATKAAGDAKKSMQLQDAEMLISMVDKIGNLFAQTKEDYDYQAVINNVSA